MNSLPTFIAVFAGLLSSFAATPAMGAFSFRSPTCPQQLVLMQLFEKHLHLWTYEIPNLGTAAADVLNMEQRALSAAQTRLEPYFRSATFSDDLYRAYLSVVPFEMSLTATEFQKALVEMPATPFAEKMVRAVYAQVQPTQSAREFSHALRIYLMKRPGLVKARVALHTVSLSMRSFLRATPTEPVAPFEDPDPSLDTALHATFFLEDDQVEFIHRLIQNRKHPKP